MHHPPTVLLDVSRLIWRSWRGQLPTGIDRACMAYVMHYRDRASAVMQRGGFTRVVGEKDSSALFSVLLNRPQGLRKEVVKRLAGSFLPGGSYGPHRLRDALYLNVGHTGLNLPGHGRWVERTGVRAIYYVYDLIPITHPQFAREGERERHIARMEAVLRHGTAVITISQDSLSTLTAFAEQRGLAMPPVLCAPLGVELPDLSGVDEISPLAEPYFVVLGTIEGRKNHMLLLDVWRRLAEREGEKPPKLVIIGQRGWAAEDVFAALDGDAGLRPHIIELGRCDDAILRQYLAHARALLFPSFAEGQGLPLIEALSAGTPVIASDLAVFRETGGTVPDYLEPYDIAGWVKAVADYSASDSSRRVAQLLRLEGFSPPTWENHFGQVDRWLAELPFIPVVR